MKNKVIFTIILVLLLIATVYAKTTLSVDINSDGVTDVKDVKAIAEKIINKSSVSNAADINQDGSVKINDVMILLKNINGFIPTTAISFGESSKTLNVGASVTLVPSMTPSYANDSITYTSSNTAVATVNSSGKVTAASKGTATITATAASSNTSAKITINVKEFVVYNPSNETATSTLLYLNSNNKDANGNVSTTLAAKINGTVISKATWSSGNENVATVDKNGNVTAVSVGKTYITASSGGISSKYLVRVRRKVVIVIGASQVNRLSCYATDDEYAYAVTKTNYCAGTKTASSITHGSIVLGKNQYNTKVTEIEKIFNAINNGESLKRTSLTEEEAELLANYRYSDSLNFIHLSGSGFEFQIGGNEWKSGALKWSASTKSGWEIAESIIRSYESVKADVGLYIYFPIAGNGTKSHACDDWSDNYKQTDYQLPSVNSQNDADKFYDFVDDYLEEYNENIRALNEEGYYAWGFIVSSHPLVPGQAGDSNGEVGTTSDRLYSDQTTACAAGKRSNLKYYLFNEVIENIIEKNYKYNKNDGTRCNGTGKCLTYVNTFNKIMDVNIDNSKTKIYNKYSLNFKNKYGGIIDSTEFAGAVPTGYSTTDGLHWDSDTVHEYLKLMLEDNSRLK